VEPGAPVPFLYRLYALKTSAALKWLGGLALAYVFVPGFQVFFHFGHKAAGVGSVDDAVIEAQG
jgi:hypothetical protein